MKLSVAIITRNEESRLAEAVDSVSGVADEILVCDSGSTDATVRIAETLGCRVVSHPFEGFAAQRNHAADVSQGDWILALDADERLSEELREEIRGLKAAEPRLAAFSMPRRTRYLGRWIRHSGWYPNRQVRLCRRDQARWEGEHIHEALVVDGRVGSLAGDLLHVSYPNLRAHLERIPDYARRAAQARLARGVRGRLWRLVILPLARGLRAYVWRAGFLDGVPGLVIAVLSAYGVFAREALLWEASRGASIERPTSTGDTRPRP